MENMLKTVGVSLYGERWQSDIAKDLGVSDRTVRRWISEPGKMPKSVYVDLSMILKNRIYKIKSVQKNLKAFIG